MLGRKVGVLRPGIQEAQEGVGLFLVPGNVNAFQVSSFFLGRGPCHCWAQQPGWRSNCVSIFITETNLPTALVEFGREVRCSSFVL